MAPTGGQDILRYVWSVMREAAFVQRNKVHWERLEQALSHPRGLAALDGEEAALTYIRITDDLSYARTFYTRSKLPDYLNGLAVRLHQHIHRNKRTPVGRFKRFWTHEVPKALATTRPQMSLSFLLFAVAMAIGALSAAHDPTFVRLIMGDHYVDMTINNIRRGEPMAVYGNSQQDIMFLGITINNIRVALLCFAAGVMAGFGTGLLLLYNGIMVGAFQYFFHEHGVLRESLLTIWVHGTLEISAIVVAGAAGLTLGKGMLFPGTYTRMHSFRSHARTGLKLVIGLVPVFIVAGFIESYMTRHALRFHPAASLSIIILSAAFVVGYFIVIPLRHATRSPHQLPPGA